MITIVCQHWGRWGGSHAPRYVERLRNGVRRHLRVPHRFVCMTDAGIDSQLSAVDIDTLPLASEHLPGNLRKLDLYRPGNNLAGRVLALDLDTLVAGRLDEIAAYDGRFCVLEDFYEPGRHGGAVVAFDAADRDLCAHLYPAAGAVTLRHRGSERRWYRERLTECDFWQTRYPGYIVSAKPEPERVLRGDIPAAARLVCFHGRPRMHEARADWIDQHWN